MSDRSLFGRNKAIERKIDEFLDKVSEAGLVLLAGIHQGVGAPHDDPGVVARLDQMLDAVLSSLGIAAAASASRAISPFDCQLIFPSSPRTPNHR